jgi:hypothetical protein
MRYVYYFDLEPIRKYHLDLKIETCFAFLMDNESFSILHTVNSVYLEPVAGRMEGYCGQSGNTVLGQKVYLNNSLKNYSTIHYIVKNAVNIMCCNQCYGSRSESISK